VNVGEKIKYFRKEQNLTQKKLGEMCGIADPNIRKYESGRLNPKIQTLKKIAKALNVSILEFIDDEPTPPPIHAAMTDKE
jgi:transcriptional regulator with XRE-family HTH domain